MESSKREQKRDSARKKREYTVYSTKAVRAKETQWANQKTSVVQVRASSAKSK